MLGERFWSKVDQSGGPDACWPWTAGVNGTGYGKYNIDGQRHRMAHRLAYEELIGPIPEGLTLDHLCRTRLCCNPAHVEPVTSGENVLRGVSLSAQNARKETCKNGHPFDRVDKRGARECSICMRAKNRAAYHRHREKRLTYARARDARYAAARAALQEPIP